MKMKMKMKMKVKVLYRDYKNKIERYYDEIDYKKGAYDKATKSIEIEFDEKYDEVFKIATYEQILKICEIIRNGIDPYYEHR